MSHVIKISGVSDELLTRVDATWKSRHFTDRSEYVRDLIRRDVLATPSISESAATLFGALHRQVGQPGFSEQEILDDVEKELRERRLGRVELRRAGKS